MKKILLILMLLFTLTACNHKQNKFEKTILALDTVITITIYEDENIKKEDAENLLKLCENKIFEWEKKLNANDKKSEVSKINNSNGEFVKTDAEILRLIEESIKFSELTNGAFDITTFSAKHLWKLENEKLPSVSEIEEAKNKINYKNIIIKNDSVSLQNGSVIDFGGIAKGYIADELKNFLKDNKVEKAIINLGGNVLTIGKKNEKESWSIGVKNPQKDSKDLAFVLSINDESVVTSGIYERFFEKNGKVYHHIINPKTAMPIDNELVSVTIIAKNSMQADLLSTSCFVLGVDEGLKLCDKFGIEAVFIEKDGHIHKTKNFDSYIKQ